jgi:Na+/glutamate symporter
VNTPAHAIINLLILGRQSAGKKTIPILIGAILPDIAIFALYFWHLLLGTPEAMIWSVEYYKPGWQAFIDVFNSMPLLVLGILTCWKTKQHYLLIFFASMLLHTLGDFPLHHDDAHRHFFPLVTGVSAVQCLIGILLTMVTGRAFSK